jgi:hypothetical protein
MAHPFRRLRETGELFRSTAQDFINVRRDGETECSVQFVTIRRRIRSRSVAFHRSPCFHAVQQKLQNFAERRGVHGPGGPKNDPWAHRAFVSGAIRGPCGWEIEARPACPLLSSSHGNATEPSRPISRFVAVPRPWHRRHSLEPRRTTGSFEAESARRRDGRPRVLDEAP